MAIQAKELRNKAGKLAKRQQEILEKASDVMTADEEKEFDTLHDQEQTLIRQAKKIEDLEKLEAEDEAREGEAQKNAPGKKELSKEQVKEVERIAIREFMATGRVSPELHAYMKPAKAEKDDNSWIDRELKGLGITRAAQQSTTDGSGGYTIPQGFQAELERATLAFGGMFETARIWRTSTGNNVDWPKVDDTMNEAYQLSEAANAETSATKITDATQAFEAYKWTSGLIRVSSELITDSAFDMPSFIVDVLSERMFRGGNRVFTTGDGSTKPKGITVAASHGNNTADDAAIAYDDWLNLIHDVDPSYRNRPGTRLMFHDSVLLTLKKLKDSQNLPVWLPSMREGDPSTIFGYRYTVNQHMASFVAGSTTANDNKKIALFGDFQKYIIRLVQNMRIVRLNERFGDTDEVGFVLFWRWDGDLLDAGTHPVKYMRVSAT